MGSVIIYRQILADVAVYLMSLHITTVIASNMLTPNPTKIYIIAGHVVAKQEHAQIAGLVVVNIILMINNIFSVVLHSHSQ